MSERPKICQILHGMTVGGAEILAERLARKLSDEFEMTFLCLDEVGELGRELEADNFTVKCLDRRPGVDLGCTRRLARNLRNLNIQLVVAHQYTPFFYSAASRLWGGGPPIMFVEHGRAMPDYPRRKRMIFNRIMVRPKDRMIAVGQDVRRALIENEGLPVDRVEVVYNGVNLAPITTSLPHRSAVRQELGLESHELLIMQVARLDYLKDHLTAIRTMSELVKTVPQARLMLVGEGSERSRIEQAIAEHNLQSHVQLLGLRKDVSRILPAADIMLLTSISEGIPLTLIEGMAARLPIVATDVGGVAEVISNEQTGLLAPAQHSVQLAHHLQVLADNPERRRYMGETGERIAQEKFSEEVMHSQYVNLFNEMLKLSPSFPSSVVERSI